MGSFQAFKEKPSPGGAVSAHNLFFSKGSLFHEEKNALGIS